MPELPEVETTKRGISPHAVNKTVKAFVSRTPKLRYDIPKHLETTLKSSKVLSIERRSKYILMNFKNGSLIIHLGMSGSISICDPNEPLKKHDHVDIILNDNTCLRYNDPRRFGCIVWQEGDASEHKLLSDLGPEPFSEDFNFEYLYPLLKRRPKTSIKQVIMDPKIVVGVGNIYASESLFLSGIRPQRKATKVTKKECEALIKNIRIILKLAIDSGGSTIRNYSNHEHKPGYFVQQLNVYDKEECTRCQSSIKKIVLGQRSSFYCSNCQR